MIENTKKLPFSNDGRMHLMSAFQTLLLGLLLSFFAATSMAQAPTQAWRTELYSNGNGQGSIGNRDARSRPLVTDSAGNVFVTGSNLNGDGYYEFLTIKYNAAGMLQWRAVSRSNSGYGAFAFSIALDSVGNVIVSGAENGVNGFGPDFLTIKYDANGTELWRASLDNGYSDNMYGMALDTNDNIIVFGSSYNGTNDDYTTVKYNAAGIEMWRRTASAASSSFEFAGGVAVDAAGNVYVSGTAFNGASRDFFTIKYDAGGTEQWRKTADGPLGGTENVEALTLDAAANIYVAGYTSLADGITWMLVKYNAAGDELWRAIPAFGVQKFNVPRVVRVDAAGNVFVAGSSAKSGGTEDYALVKFAPDGTEQWRRVVNGSGGGSDIAGALAIAPNGDIVVTGATANANGYHDFLTIRYDTLGVETWRATESVPGSNHEEVLGVVFDPTGNVIIAGNISRNSLIFDFKTVKYNAAGQFQWRADEGIDNRQNAILNAMKLDAAGNVYVAASTSNGLCPDLQTVKLNAAGIEQWRKKMGVEPNCDGRAVAIALDGEGNVITTGFVRNGATNRDFITVKYSGSGVELWRALSNGADNRNDVPSAITVDRTGNIYVTGSSEDAVGARHYLTVKYSALGVELWRSIARSGDDIASAIALDNDGNVLVTGTSSDQVSGRYRIMTLKYDLSGNELWRSTTTTLPGGSDRGNAIATDSSGNVYVAGSYYNGSSADFITIKYSATGAELWRVLANGGGNSSDMAEAIAVQDDGSIYVAGYGTAPGNLPSILLVKYDPSGSEVWRKESTGQTNLGAYFLAMATEGGNVYVAGSARSMAMATGSNAIVMKYGPDGAEKWSITANGNIEAYSAEGAQSVALDESGSVFVGSTSQRSGLQARVAVSRYFQPVTQVSLTGVKSRKTHGASGVFDLPIDPTVAIGGNVTVEPRNAAGNATLVFVFNSPVSSIGSVSATDGSGGSLSASVEGIAGNEVAISLPAIAERSRAQVLLNGVNGVLDASAAIGFLIGDINNSRSVNASDISGVKARAGQTTNASNFRFDLNASGGINATDIAAVKARSGLVLP